MVIEVQYFCSVKGFGVQGFCQVLQLELGVMGKCMWGDDEEDVGEVVLCKVGMKLLLQIKNKYKWLVEYVKVWVEKIKVKKQWIKVCDVVEWQVVEFGEVLLVWKILWMIENIWEVDEIVVQFDDEEFQVDDGFDEFSGYFSCVYVFKFLIIIFQECFVFMCKFIKEFLIVILNVIFYKCGLYDLKQIVKYVLNWEFMFMFVVNENWKELNGLFIVVLFEGLIVYFKLLSIQFSKKIKGYGKVIMYMFEFLLNNFMICLGY